ncbi:hypothetical protein ACHAWF_001335, partial [Thalassiosira exigua]
RTWRYFERVRKALREAEDEDRRREATAESTRRRPRQLSAERRDRLYCVVPFVWTPKFLPSYHAIRATWGKRCDVLKFAIDPVIGDEEGGFLDLRLNGSRYELPDDVAVIDMRRPWNACPDSKEGTCRSIWEKVWRSWIWVDEHDEGADRAEWYAKVDADAYIVPENLKRYVRGRNWSPDEHRYFGHALWHRAGEGGGGVPMIAGAATFFSRATMKAAADVFRAFRDSGERGSSSGKARCGDAHTDREEAILSACLKDRLGVDAVPALDDAGRELVSIFEIDEALRYERPEPGEEWWYWKNKPQEDPETGRELHGCCGDLPIAFHGPEYKDPRWLRRIDEEVYPAEAGGAHDVRQTHRWRHPRTTEGYFDRVRKAMREAKDVAF